MAVQQRDHPPIEDCWEEVARREEVSQFVEFRDIIEAAAEADSVYDVCRLARIQRAKAVGILTWFGLADAANTAGRNFPPDDLEYRLHQLQQGHLPSDARAREWGGPNA